MVPRDVPKPCIDQSCYTYRVKFEVAAIRDTRPGGYTLFSLLGNIDAIKCSFLFNGRDLVSALLYHPLPLHLYSTVTLASSQPERNISSNVYSS